MKFKLIDNWRIVILSVISWIICFLIEDSQVIEIFSDKLNRIDSSKGFGLLIFMYLIKYFFYLSGIISIFFIAYLLFKKKE